MSASVAGLPFSHTRVRGPTAIVAVPPFGPVTTTASAETDCTVPGLAALDAPAVLDARTATAGPVARSVKVTTNPGCTAARLERTPFTSTTVRPPTGTRRTRPSSWRTTTACGRTA